MELLKGVHGALLARAGVGAAPPTPYHAKTVHLAIGVYCELSSASLAKVWLSKARSFRTLSRSDTRSKCARHFVNRDKSTSNCIARRKHQKKEYVGQVEMLQEPVFITQNTFGNGKSLLQHSVRTASHAFFRARRVAVTGREYVRRQVRMDARITPGH